LHIKADGYQDAFNKLAAAIKARNGPAIEGALAAFKALVTPDKMTKLDEDLVAAALFMLEFIKIRDRKLFIWHSHFIPRFAHLHFLDIHLIHFTY